jgi:hypothetical protein
MPQDDMHAVVVRMHLDPDRTADVDRHLRDDVLPWARVQPGFVGGRWLRSDDGTSGTGVILFRSTTAASAAAAGPRAAVYPSDNPWTIAAVEVCSVVAEAETDVVRAGAGR